MSILKDLAEGRVRDRLLQRTDRVFPGREEGVRKMDESKKTQAEIESLRIQVHNLKAFLTITVCVMILIVVNFQMQYSRMTHYYQETIQTNQELGQSLETVISNLQKSQELSSSLQDILLEKGAK